MKPFTPPENLNKAIIERLASIELRQKRTEKITFGALTIVSVVGLVPALVLLWNNLAASGIGSFASLMLSDSDAFISYWKEIGMSVAESLPVPSIVAVLAAAFIVTWSWNKTRRALHSTTFVVPIHA